MAMMKKRMTFHGVDYIVVPQELWDGVKEGLQQAERKCSERYSEVEFVELRLNMLAYEGSNEPVELTDE